MLGSLGWEELLVLLAIVALVAGASRVGELGGALGRGIREFRTEASRPPTPEEEPTAALPAAPAPSEAATASEAPAAPIDAAPIDAAPATELLANLERLHAAGVLTDAEFAAKRDALEVPAAPVHA